MISKEDLKKMDASALKGEILSLKKELFNLKLGLLTGQVKDVSQFKKLRKALARTLTFLGQQQPPEVKQRLGVSSKA